MLKINRTPPKSRQEIVDWYTKFTPDRRQGVTLTIISTIDELLHSLEELKVVGSYVGDDQAVNLIDQPGVHAVFGNTHSGKSTVGRKMAASLNGMSLFVEEPEKGAFSCFEEISDALANNREYIDLQSTQKTNGVAFSPVIVVDSVKLSQFEIPGTSTYGGLSAGFMRFLNDLSTFAVRREISIILVCNGLLPPDHVAYELVMQRVEANVNSIISGHYKTGWNIRSRFNSSRGSVPLSNVIDVDSTSIDGDDTETIDITLHPIKDRVPDQKNRNVTADLRKQEDRQDKLRDVTLLQDGEDPSWTATNGALDFLAED